MDRKGARTIEATRTLIKANEFRIPKGILLLTLPQHILGLGAAIYLIAGGHAHWSYLGITYGAWIAIGVIGMGIFYHKYLAHHAFETSPWFAAIGTYFGALAGLAPPQAWVILHNDHHHRFADRSDQDFHSPSHGFFSSYLGWHFKPIRLKLRERNKKLRNPWVKILGRHYFKIYWATAVLLLLIDYRLPVFALFLPGFIHFHFESIIASFCHQKKWGYRNFETNDDSVNIGWLGALTWGASYHNNHHGAPTAWHNEIAPHEWDPTKYIIRLIRTNKGANN